MIENSDDKYQKIMNVSVSPMNGKFQASVKLEDGTIATSKPVYENPEDGMQWALEFAEGPQTIEKLESTAQFTEGSGEA